MIIWTDPPQIKEIEIASSVRGDKNIKTEEIIKMLKKGESFIKYGNKGNPHTRLVQLTQDEKKIIWKNNTGCKIFCHIKSINVSDVNFLFIFLDKRCLFRNFFKQSF